MSRETEYFPLGINPWPTFDYNFILVDPIITPLFATLNNYVGMIVIGLPFICIVYWRNICELGLELVTILWLD